MNIQGKTGSIGILTFHRCINYGSYWQARCLVEGLRARGHEAVILDHDSWQIRRAEWACGLQPVLPTPVARTDRVLYGLKMLKFFRAVAELPRSPRFSLDNPAAMAPCERVIVGSDEVWNLSHPWYGGCALFFGAGLRARRLIAYAASFGNYPAARGLAPAWAERLREFAALSVRDANSRHIIRAALGVEPAQVLDPCLQFPFSQGLEDRWRGGPRRPFIAGPRRPFVVVYGHNFSAPFRREVRRWAASQGLPLVSVGYRNAWADAQWLTAGPHDFAWCMAQARAVATNFFHGCAFALRHAKPFVCESSPYRFTKIRDLLAAVGGEQHQVTEATAPALYDALLNEPLDTGILRQIDDLRRASDAYLDTALA